MTLVVYPNMGGILSRARPYESREYTLAHADVRIRGRAAPDAELRRGAHVLTVTQTFALEADNDRRLTDVQKRVSTMRKDFADALEFTKRDWFEHWGVPLPPTGAVAPRVTCKLQSVSTKASSANRATVALSVMCTLSEPVRLCDLAAHVVLSLQWAYEGGGLELGGKGPASTMAAETFTVAEVAGAKARRIS